MQMNFCIYVTYLFSYNDNIQIKKLLLSSPGYHLDPCLELVKNVVLAKSIPGIRNTSSDQLIHHLTSLGKKVLDNFNHANFNSVEDAIMNDSRSMIELRC
jgi:hypothetical protein